MGDWITWSIELVGVGILCIWLIIPVREFREIAARLRRKDGDGGRRP